MRAEKSVRMTEQGESSDTAYYEIDIERARALWAMHGHDGLN